MWDCEECGCMMIAESIQACPMCGTAKPEEPVGEPTPEPDENGGEDNADS